MALLLLTALLGACPGKPDDDADSGEARDTDDVVDDTVVPLVEEVTYAGCSLNTDDEDTWVVMVAANDPQGRDTVAGGALSIREGEVERDEIALACFEGACSGGWEHPTNGVGCDFVGSFRVVVEDVDGHLSRPFDFAVE